jgi:HAD superfamily hydrolase (TIGR01509 family)
MGLAAVFFDMDGLLVDTEPLWFETEVLVSRRLGLPSWTHADQQALLGGSLERSVAYLLARATRPVPPAVLADWIMDDVEDRIRAEGAPVRPGARELYLSLLNDAVPVALVTSSQRRFMDVVLESTGFRFPVTVCAQDVAHTKPDPEPYQLATKLLGVAPGSCVVLEDSPNGVASGEAAGCHVVAVPSFIPIPPAPGRTVVPSLAALTPAHLRTLVLLSRPLAPCAPAPSPPRRVHPRPAAAACRIYRYIAGVRS